MSAAAQAAVYIKATYLARLSGAAEPALRTAADSKAMHIAVLASAAAQVQHRAAYSQAIYPAKLPGRGAAAQEQHTATYISARHSSIEGLPVAAEHHYGEFTGRRRASTAHCAIYQRAAHHYG